MVVWSIVGSAQYYLKGRTSFLVCRALLGMLQGGFIPEVSIFIHNRLRLIFLQIILYLSYFYKHHELSLRLGFFWTASAMADVLGGFLAFGILHLRGVEGQAGWRWLFLIKVSPSSPSQTLTHHPGTYHPHCRSLRLHSHALQPHLNGELLPRQIRLVHPPTKKR